MLLLFFILIAKNIARTRTGVPCRRSATRDIAAEVMGVPEFKYKMTAFAASSFLAGIGGVLFASLAGKLPATQWNLTLSVEFIAILLIGGVGTVSGVMFGTFFVILGPNLVEEFTVWLSDRAGQGGVVGTIADDPHRGTQATQVRSRSPPKLRGTRSTSSTGTSSSTGC